jgi:hypothetical protein
MKIWCLFAIENNYDQPDNNLVAWWQEKPGLECLLSFFDVDLSNTDAVVRVVHIWDGRVERLGNNDYRLREIEEGRV